MCLKFA
jgi:large subunit ribosomal protein L5e